MDYGWRVYFMSLIINSYDCYKAENRRQICLLNRLQSGFTQPGRSCNVIACGFRSASFFLWTTKVNPQKFRKIIKKRNFKEISLILPFVPRRFFWWSRLCSLNLLCWKSRKESQTFSLNIQSEGQANDFRKVWEKISVSDWGDTDAILDLKLLTINLLWNSCFDV